jgi:hypothetical protein
MENSLPTLLENGLEPPVPLTHNQIILELMYGASCPPYSKVFSDLMISTIMVQLGVILASSLHSEANSDLESGRGLHSETASDGCSALNIPLLDAPHVAPLIIPQWRRPDRRNRVTVPHDATIPPPYRFQPKYTLESPKWSITHTPVTQSFRPRFRIRPTHTMACCLDY